MHKATILATVAALAMATVCHAAPKPKRMNIALGTNTTGSVTLGVKGYLDAVYVAVSDGVSTGQVEIAYAPYVGGTSVTFATNAVTDEKVFRPVVDVTDTAGTGLTSDEPTRFVLAGETVTFTVSGSPTGLTWRCVLIIDE